VIQKVDVKRKKLAIKVILQHLQVRISILRKRRQIS
jgi:hypothetical protein